jgi:hypothetical protein
LKYSIQHLFRNILATIISLVWCGIASQGFAQIKTLSIRGIVYSKNINVRLSNVLITNEVTHASVINDQLGAFEIKAAIGDTLLFECRNFSDQKVAVTADVSLFVFMVPILQLMQVDIKDVTKKQDLAEAMKGYKRQGIYGNGKTTVLGAIISPLNGLYDLFGSGPKNARRFGKFAARENEQSEIDRRFNRPFIRQCTGIKDSVKLEIFMLSYRPQVEDIRKWTEYDLRAYIKKSYESFEASGEKPPMALPKLEP